MMDFPLPKFNRPTTRTSKSDVAKKYGIEPIYRMSYNESPLGPSPKVVDAIRETAVSIGDYPPMGDATAVSQAILPFGVMVRPLSAPGLENCLRISISTQAGNHQFMHGLEQILSRKDLIE